jgi:hypothetical protein
VTKPSVAGFGMNWQHCSRVAFVGASHSYEQTYQAIRRCWRFGQKESVRVYVVRAETEDAIVSNYHRKERDADRMRDVMATSMGSLHDVQAGAMRREWNEYAPSKDIVIPEWIGMEEM